MKVAVAIPIMPCSDFHLPATHVTCPRTEDNAIQLCSQEKRRHVIQIAPTLTRVGLLTICRLNLPFSEMVSRYTIYEYSVINTDLLHNWTNTHILINCKLETSVLSSRASYLKLETSVEKALSLTEPRYLYASYANYKFLPENIFHRLSQQTKSKSI